MLGVVNMVRYLLPPSAYPWHTRSRQSVQVTDGSTVMSQVGSLLTYGLGHIKSGTLHPYQIIFLFCGYLTVAWSIVTL